MDDDLCISNEWNIIIDIKSKIVGGLHSYNLMMDIAVNKVNRVPSLILVDMMIINGKVVVDKIWYQFIIKWM